MTLRRQTQTILESAARTATNVSTIFTSNEALATTFVIDVTAITATPSVVPLVEGKDPLSGSFYTILSGTAFTATGTTTMQVGKDLEIVSGEAASDFLPAEYRVTFTHADADSITYSVSAIHLVEI